LKQGSNNLDSPWATARLGWARQLALRLGLIVITALGYGPFKKYFQPDLISPLYKDGMSHWDEVHRKCVPGSGIAGGSKQSILRFPRDATGKLDLVDGTYSIERVSQMKCKYTDEVRLCLGNAVVTPIDEDGNQLPKEGRVAKPYDYTGTVLLSHKDYTGKINKELKRVKTVPNGGEWVQKRRDGNTIYRNDPMSVLKGCGRAFSGRLAQHGVDFIWQLNALSEESIAQISSITTTEGECHEQRLTPSKPKQLKLQRRIAQLIWTTGRPTIHTKLDMANNGWRCSPTAL
jgi:hypothetical protein